MTNRTKREYQDRDSQARNEHWVHPSNLDVPNPEPGFSYKWVKALNSDGKEDTKNLIDALRQGYEPVRISDMPEGFFGDKVRDGEFKDTVRTGDLILMKIPEEKKKQRAAWVKNRTMRQERAIREELRKKGADRQMPVFDESRESNSVGQRKPEFQEG